MSQHEATATDIATTSASANNKDIGSGDDENLTIEKAAAAAAAITLTPVSPDDRCRSSSPGAVTSNSNDNGGGGDSESLSVQVTNGGTNNNECSISSNQYDEDVRLATEMAINKDLPSDELHKRLGTKNEQNEIVNEVIARQRSWEDSCAKSTSYDEKDVVAIPANAGNGPSSPLVSAIPKPAGIFRRKSTSSSTGSTSTGGGDTTAILTSASTGMTISECLYGTNIAIDDVGSFDEDDGTNLASTAQKHEIHPSVSEDCDGGDSSRRPHLKEMADHKIDLRVLRKLSSQGIPDAGCHRGLVWRVLLGYLPADCSQWEAALREKRKTYATFVEMLFADDSELGKGNELRGRPRHHRHRRRRRRGRRQQQQRTDDSIGNDNSALEMENKNSEDVSESSHSEDTSSSCGNHDVPVVPKTNIPEKCKTLWKEQGRDVHVLESLTESLNALQLEPLADDTTTATTTTTKESEAAAAAAEDQVKTTTTEATAADTGGKEGEESVEDDDNEGIMSNEQRQHWNDFMESAVLLDQIRKDVVRTHPDLAFFLDPQKNLGQRRYAALERILFVWSKYNKGVRYVQGMNEIAGVLYYVLANDDYDNDDDDPDNTGSWACHAEADTYWLFSSLLSEMRDVFVPDLDDADTGIIGRIENMSNLLERHDPAVNEHLEELGIDASFYAVRWLTTLLSREFLLPDTIRLWDSMFASTHKDNFLRYVCITMVMLVRDDLLKGDFSTCIRLLQSYPSTNMDGLLESSRVLWIYESQITLACHKGGISLHQALRAVPPPPAIIMAFGLSNGAATKSAAVEHLEQAGEKAAAKVLDATNKIAHSAHGFFGRAKGSASKLYKKYSEEYQEYQQSQQRGQPSQNSESQSSPKRLNFLQLRRHATDGLSGLSSFYKSSEANNNKSKDANLAQENSSRDKDNPSPGDRATTSAMDDEDCVYLQAFLSP